MTGRGALAAAEEGRPSAGRLALGGELAFALAQLALECGEAVLQGLHLIDGFRLAALGVLYRNYLGFLSFVSALIWLR